jgi:hypothetical protein
MRLDYVKKVKSNFKYFLICLLYVWFNYIFFLTVWGGGLFCFML